VVVAVESVRGHDEIAHTRVVGEHDLDRNRLAPSATTLVENVSDGVGGERTATVSLDDRQVEIGGAAPIEQAKQSRGRSSEVPAVQGDLVEERVCARATGDQAIAPAMIARLAFLASQRGEVRFVLDLLARVPRAVVPGDLLVAVEHADRRVGGDESERLANERMRDRVVVAIEADVRRLAGCDRVSTIA